MRRVSTILGVLENSPVAGELALVHASESELGLDLLVTVAFRELEINVLGDKAAAVVLVGYGDLSRGKRIRIDELVDLGLMTTRLEPDAIKRYPNCEETEELTETLLEDFVLQLPAIEEALRDPQRFAAYELKTRKVM